MRLSAQIALILAAGIAPVASARAQHFPTNEDLRHTRALRDPQLSPDGRSVLVSVTEPTVEGARSHLWVVDLASNTSRQLTFSPPGAKNSEGRGRWSTDGRFVYFVARRSDRSELFRLPMNGGEARPIELTTMPMVDASRLPDAVAAPRDASPAGALPIDVSSFALSPDGLYAAIVARDPQTPGEKKQQADRADAVLVDHDLHGTRAYLLDLRTDKLTSVGVPPDVGQVVWSHHSDRFVAISGPMNNASDLMPADTAWLVTVTEPAHPTRIVAMPTTVGSVAWSSDDARLFFTAQAEEDAPPGVTDLFSVALTDGKIANFSKRFRGIISSVTASDGDGMIVSGVTGTTAGLTRLDRAGVLTPIDLGGDASQVSTNKRHTGWVYVRSSGDQPAALFHAASLGGPATRLSLPATAGDWSAVAPRIVHWKSDAFTIEGLLYLPPQAASRRVPLIVDVHGGPTGVWRNTYSPVIQFLMGQGWAVLQPNPRGSTGYGATFAAANKNDLGGGDFRDIMRGVDAVIASDSIDGNRLALIGYSYGGEMAGFAEGKTDRFKAIVSGAPVIDQFSEYGTENGSWYDRWYFGKPWERMADAWRQSPLSGVVHAKTPFMLLQGEADRTDPLGQSLEMYRALRQAGVSVQLVQYPREDHGPLSAGIDGQPSPEPWHGFDARQRIVKFISDAFAK